MLQTWNIQMLRYATKLGLHLQSGSAGLFTESAQRVENIFALVYRHSAFSACLMNNGNIYWKLFHLLLRRFFFVFSVSLLLLSSFASVVCMSVNMKDIHTVLMGGNDFILNYVEWQLENMCVNCVCDDDVDCCVLHTEMEICFCATSICVWYFGEPFLVHVCVLTARNNVCAVCVMLNWQISNVEHDGGKHLNYISAKLCIPYYYVRGMWMQIYICVMLNHLHYLGMLVWMSCQRTGGEQHWIAMKWSRSHFNRENSI